jgi:COP9 signalosome complex subunit 2
MSKGSLLLEAYCLEIQLCSATRDAARMRRIYPNTLNMNDVVSDPRIMGLIREEGGKMYMSEGLWIDAYNELYEAFRNYQVWAVNNFLLTALDQLCSIIDFVRYLCYY